MFDDAGVDGAVLDAGVIDAGNLVANDGGRTDASTHVRDAGTGLDAGANDAAIDAGTPDVGFGPVAPGTYTYRPVTSPGGNTELTHVAIAPDGQTMVVSERYDRVHVLALPAETLVRSVTLPRVSNETVAVSALRYAADGRAVVISVTAYAGATTSGRVIQMGPRGEQPTGKGPLFANVAFESMDVHPTVPDAFRIVGRANGALRMYRYEVDANAPALEGSVAASVGCQDATAVDDGSGGRTTVYACGMNGGAVGRYDGASS
ncbi:MAG: hypothetical protein MO852_17610, partial [Candidatus Devosia euplotis]|nr:hypothetical protein [Candidatus Devosia euplotis]